MMSPGLIAISEWRTVRPKRAQPLAEPQFFGFGRVSWVHQPTRADLWGVNRTRFRGVCLAIRWDGDQRSTWVLPTDRQQAAQTP